MPEDRPADVQSARTTKYIRSPEWTGTRFSHPVANDWWLELPSYMRGIAGAELNNGNKAEQILKNEDRKIVSLELRAAPRTATPDDPRMRIHTGEDYCYDGTLCTYEDRASGHILVFYDSRE